MTASKKAKKRQRQRRQKARAKARKLAVRQTAAPAARTTTRTAGSVATIERPRPEVRRIAVPAPVERPRPEARPAAVPAPVEPPDVRATPPAVSRPVAPAPAVAPPVVRDVPPEKGADRRKITAGVAAALLSVAALVGAALLLMHPGSGDGRAERAAATSYAPPRAVPPNTSYVVTRVLSSGDLRVTHWIESRTPVSAIRLDEPHVAGLPSLHVSRVVVVGNGTRAIHSSGNKREYYVTGARHVYVRYTLQGAVTRAPQPPGRALAVITNLQVDGVPGLTQTTHSVLGARVLNLACSAPSPEALPAPCGVSGGKAWRATLDGSEVDDRVMAQLDLGADTQQ
jgi:hypothetical protein